MHRIGRTARAGAAGDAISFGCENYAMSLPDIEAFIGRKIPVATYDHTALVAVAAHTHGKEGIVWASNAGVRSVDHASYMDDEAARVLRRNGTYYIPTLYVIEPIIAEGNPLKITEESLAKAREVRGHMRNAFRAALKAGVRIGFGTDAGVFPHGTQAKEFRIYVDGGMAPMEAIQCATRVAAECMGWERKVGAIEPGRYADLIAVTGDPLRNIGELENVRWVMKGGDVVKDELAR